MSPHASITATTGTNWFDPKHDAAGNMTEMHRPGDLANGLEATYDAWNRLVKLVDKSVSTPIATSQNGRRHYRGTLKPSKKTHTAKVEFVCLSWAVLTVNAFGCSNHVGLTEVKTEPLRSHVIEEGGEVHTEAHVWSVGNYGILDIGHVRLAIEGKPFNGRSMATLTIERPEGQ